MLPLVIAWVKQSAPARAVEARLSLYLRAAACAAIAALAGLLAIIFLAETLSAYLARHVGPVWAPLITAGVFLLLGAVLALWAYLTLKASPKPAQNVVETGRRAVARWVPPALQTARRRSPELIALACVGGLLLGRARRAR